MAQNDPTIPIRSERPREELLAGRYRLVERIGRGGVSEVWRAIDERLGREVALKLLDPVADEAFRRRFAGEARRAASIAHHNVVTVYDAVADGRAFIVMELVRGVTLDELVRRRGPLPVREAAALVSQVASALDAAHRRGVVHADVKPGNVIVAEGGTAKLADFGIARAVEGDAEHEVVGTPRYVAPEIVRGEPATPRSDEYSLGLVAWELIAGLPAFEGDTQKLLRARLDGPAPRLRSVRLAVPPAVDAAVARALDPDPARRHPSAGAFADALASGAGAAAGAGGAAVLAPAARRDAGGPAPLFDARSIPVLLVAILAALALVAFFRAFGGAVPSLTPPETAAPTAAAHRTPNVVGKSYNDAASELRAAGFNVLVGYVVDPTARGAPQQVVRQDPPADGAFTPGQRATLYIVGPPPGAANEKGGKGKD